MLKFELAEIIRNGENFGIKFKRDDVHPDSLAREVAALLNLEGGRILLGVEDDGTVSGLTRSIKHAEEMGYEPYKSGPQRSIMDEAEIRAAVRRISEEVLKESEEPDRLLILGIRTKGSYLAKRIAEELERKSQKRIEVGEIEIYGTGDDLRRLPAVDGEPSAPSVKDRAVILVDDVIHTGMTVKNALSIIFKSGRPRSVRLAVLVDRGHREMPVKPNYVGKHIPSSEKERVRVKLREVEQDERDKVVIYSIVSPGDSDQESAVG